MNKKEYVDLIKRNVDFDEFAKNLDSFKNLEALVIGDTILDHYVFVTPKGRAVKDPILSAEFKSEEMYAGGVLASANNLSSYIKKINLVTLIGDQNSQLEFIEKSLRGNIDLKTFVKKDSPTIIKKRYIDDYRRNKLFKIEYINDRPILESLSKKIVNYLSTELPKYDLVFVADFGHGFINNEIRDVLEEKSNFLSINAQSNSSNMGYNYINHYKKPNFISMNDVEMRLPLMMRFEEIDKVIDAFHEKFKYNQFLVTLGKEGCIYFNDKRKYCAPPLIESVVDTVGAGDAVSAITTLYAYSDIKNEIMPFIANCVGGIAANIIGNKEPVTKEKLLNFIEGFYNGVG